MDIFNIAKQHGITVKTQPLYLPRYSGLFFAYKNLTFQYNYLNLPSRITKSATDYIELYYTAAGQKLRKVVVEKGVPTFTDYMNGLEYTNGNLDAVYHSEGRLKN